MRRYVKKVWAPAATTVLAVAFGLAAGLGCNGSGAAMRSDAAGGAGAPEAGAADAGDPDAGGGNAAAITGRCFCGHVTYRTAGPVLNQSYCGCAGCRRAHGSLAVPWVVVPKKSLTITSGKPARVRSDAYPKDSCDGRGGERAFCPKCGTHLFWYGDRRDKVDIAAGTLDDPGLFKAKEKP